MSQSLLYLDTLSVKKYILSSPKLKEIRGASALLDNYNRLETVRIIKKLTGGDKNPEAPVNIIYANGGSGLFIVPTDKVEAITQEVSTLYARAGVSLNAISLPYDNQKNYKELMHRLHLLGEKQRYESSREPLLSHPLFRDCDSNKLEFASQIYQKDLISYSTLAKRKVNEEIKNGIRSGKPSEQTLWGRLNDLLRNQNYPDLNSLEFPEDFSVIGGYCSSGDMAMIYADGNDMGQTIREIDTIGMMQQFSGTVDEAIYKATAEAIGKHLNPRVLDPGNKNLPFDIFLIGGDDLIMLTPASRALEVACTIGEAFARFTRAPLKELGIEEKTLSLGVAFCKPKYSVRNLLNITEGLLKSAKQARVRKGINEGMINFMQIQHSGLLEWENYKNRYFQSVLKEEEYLRTCRPYSFNDLKRLMQFTENLKSSRLPPGKLELLKEASFTSYHESLYKTHFVLTRCNDKKREKGGLSEQESLRQALAFPALLEKENYSQEDEGVFCVKKAEKKRSYATAINDMLEIYEYTGGKAPA